MSTSDGFIHVYPSDDDVARVYFIVFKGDDFQRISRQELEEKVEIVIRSSDAFLEINIRTKERYGWSEWRNAYNVSCEVYVPSKTSCDLKSSDGDIRLSGLNGSQKCRTSDGDIYGSGIEGAVDAVTSDGNVELHGIKGAVSLESSDGDLLAEDVEGDATFQTSDGDINMARVSGMVESATSDGDIMFRECAGSFRGVTSDGDIRGDLVKIQGLLSASTSDGDIDVKIPEGSGIDLKMRGEDLYLPRVELSGQVDEHYIRGAINGGGVPVDLITSDGSVRLSFQ